MAGSRWMQVGTKLWKTCVAMLVLMVLFALMACSSGSGGDGQGESSQVVSSAISAESGQSEQEAKAAEEAAAKKAAEEAAAKEKAAADAKAKLESVALESTTSVLEYSDKTTDPMKLVTCDDSSVQVAAAGTVDLGKLGKQDVTYTLTADGQSVQCTVSFEVRDTKKPKIKLDKESVTIEPGASYDPLDNVKSVADPVDGDLKRVDTPPETKGSKAGEEQFYDAGWYVVEGEVNNEKAGKYFLTIRAQDRNGNEASKQFTVMVNKPESEQAEAGAAQESSGYTYVVNRNNGVFHHLDCPSVDRMNPENREYTTKSRDQLEAEKKTPCGNCNP